VARASRASTRYRGWTAGSAITMNASVVRAGPGVAGLPLEVLETCVDGLPDHGVDLGDQTRPVLVAGRVTATHGQARIPSTCKCAAQRHRTRMSSKLVSPPPLTAP
jgi:hypothetical protein